MKFNVSVIEYDENFTAMVDFIDGHEWNNEFKSFAFDVECSDSKKRFISLFIISSILNAGIEFDYEHGEAGKDLKNELTITIHCGTEYEVDLLKFFNYLTTKSKEELFYMRYAKRVGFQWLLEDFLDSGIDSPIRRLD